MAAITPTSQNFYLSGLSSTVSTVTAAALFPSKETSNFTDYSANAICRMKLSVAKNMFQFWAKSAEISGNSLGDLAFRCMYDPSSGFNVNDLSANPMSDDFTLGTIVTWSDPSNAQMNVINENGSFYQTLFPQAYLRYLSWLIFKNANSTSNFLNSTAVMESVNIGSKAALNATLKNITAYNQYSIANAQQTDNIGRQWTYNNYQVDPNNFSINTGALVEAQYNPSALIFQQIRKNDPSRIANMNPTTEKIIDASGNGAYPGGAWYKMPFKSGDSIYFILTINTPIGQKDDQDQVVVGISRKYRIRMYIMDDTVNPSTGQSVLSSQTTDATTGGNPIVYGQFAIYPTIQSKVKLGYSYADTSGGDDPNDVAPGALPGGIKASNPWSS